MSIRLVLPVAHIDRINCLTVILIPKDRRGNNWAGHVMSLRLQISQTLSGVESSVRLTGHVVSQK